MNDEHEVSRAGVRLARPLTGFGYGVLVVAGWLPVGRWSTAAGAQRGAGSEQRTAGCGDGREAGRGVLWLATEINGSEVVVVGGHMRKGIGRGVPWEEPGEWK